MPAFSQKLLFLAMLVCISSAFGEDVQITVFTLKDGTKVEALSFASAEKEGEAVFLVTTTTGDRKTLWGNEVVRKEGVQKSFNDLPEYARGKLEAQRKAEKEWMARAAAAKSEEDRKRTEALIKGEELSGKYDVVRAAAAEEQVARQRCAMLWDAHQGALNTVKSTQDSIARARNDYDNAADELRLLDRWHPDTPEEIQRWRARRIRAERRINSAEDQIRDSTRDLAAATEQANQHAAELAKAKTVLAQAQAKLTEAQRQYNEAREQARKKPVPSDPASEVIRPVDQVTSEKRPAGNVAPAAQAPKSTVVRSFEQGEFVQLADGSLWDIHPEDRAEAARWLPEQDVSVVKDADATYANRLVNSATHSAVKAKRLK